MNRQEHLQWCKDRALEYVDIGDLPQALASMSSDISKHPETACTHISKIGLQMMMIGELSTPEKMRKWINGYN